MRKEKGKDLFWFDKRLKAFLSLHYWQSRRRRRRRLHGSRRERCSAVSLRWSLRALCTCKDKLNEIRVIKSQQFFVVFPGVDSTATEISHLPVAWLPTMPFTLKPAGSSTQLDSNPIHSTPSRPASVCHPLASLPTCLNTCRRRRCCCGESPAPCALWI